MVIIGIAKGRKTNGDRVPSHGNHKVLLTNCVDRSAVVCVHFSGIVRPPVQTAINIFCTKRSTRLLFVYFIFVFWCFKLSIFCLPSTLVFLQETCFEDYLRCVFIFSLPTSSVLREFSSTLNVFVEIVSTHQKPEYWRWTHNVNTVRKMFLKKHLCWR